MTPLEPVAPLPVPGGVILLVVLDAPAASDVQLVSCVKPGRAGTLEWIDYPPPDRAVRPMLDVS